MDVPNPGQVAVDPSNLIRHQQMIGQALVSQLSHDLAITRAMLDDCRAEGERLARVNEALTQQLDPQQATAAPPAGQQE